MKSFKDITTEQAMRYARQIALPGFDLEGQERLLSARVLVIGAGGLGCAAAQYLVAAGIGLITLVDDDRVERSNLHRQILHQETSLGQLKVDSAKQTLQSLNSECEILTIAHRLTSEELLDQIAEHDLVLDCSDNLDTRVQVNQCCATHSVPLVSGAAIRFEGQVSTFTMRTGTPCYQCLAENMDEQPLSCMEAGVIGPLVGMVGSIQALEAIKLLTSVGQVLSAKLLTIDGRNMQFSSFIIQQNSNCEVCKS